jgi:hypothetical protein
MKKPFRQAKQISFLRLKINYFSLRFEIKFFNAQNALGLKRLFLFERIYIVYNKNKLNNPIFQDLLRKENSEIKI